MINIAELLKNAPKDLKLYSPICGHCKLSCILCDNGIRVIAHDVPFRFDEYGRFYIVDDAECLLFPSKDCRTWEGWKLPVEPKFKVSDWIISDHPDAIFKVGDVKKTTYKLIDIYGDRYDYQITEIDKNYHLWTIADAKDGDVLATDNIICIFKKLDKDGYYIISPCIYTVKDGLEVIDDEDNTIGSCGFKPATKEDRELLFRKMKEEGYTWDKKKKELCKIQPHYDIANFKPKQWVLTRDTSEWDWELTMFAYLNSDGGSKFTCINGVTFKQCIPYNDDTKHLLGTTDKCDECYVNW